MKHQTGGLVGEVVLWLHWLLHFHAGLPEKPSV